MKNFTVKVFIALSATLPTACLSAPQIGQSTDEKGIAQNRESQLPYLGLVKRTYEADKGGYSRLFEELKRDDDIQELYCDPELIYVTLESGTYYLGENHPYPSKYAELCKFTAKVSVKRGNNSLGIPIMFFEVGRKFATVSLAKKLTSNNHAPDCRSSFLSGDSGNCLVRIADDWFAAYYWEPF